MKEYIEERGPKFTTADVHVNSTDDLADDNQSNDTSSECDDTVVPFERVQSDTDDEDGVNVTGRSNPVGKKTHVDYVIDSDGEENLIVVRTSTAEYPRKEKTDTRNLAEPKSPVPSINVVGVDEANKGKFGKANVSQRKTSVSFKKSKLCTKGSSKKKSKSEINEENKEEEHTIDINTGGRGSKFVPVPFKSELETEAKKKPRGRRQFSLESQTSKEDMQENENHEDYLFSDEIKNKESKRMGSSSERYNRNSDETLSSSDLLNVADPAEDVYGTAKITTPSDKDLKSTSRGASGRRRRLVQHRSESIDAGDNRELNQEDIVFNGQQSDEVKSPRGIPDYDEEIRGQYTPSFVKGSPARSLSALKTSDASELVVGERRKSKINNDSNSVRRYERHSDIHTRTTDGNSNVINVREAETDEYGKASVAQHHRRTNSRRQDQNSSNGQILSPGRNKEHDEDVFRSSSTGFLQGEDEMINVKKPTVRTSRPSTRNLDVSSRKHTTGNITIDDRNNPFRDVKKTKRRDTHDIEDNGKMGDDFDGDTDALYFAGGEVPNETIHKYEVAQAEPETYGTATVIRHGKKK